MKTNLKIFAFILLFTFILSTTACDEPTPPDIPCLSHVDANNDKVCDNCKEFFEPVPEHRDPVIEVVALKDNINLNDEEIENFDFKTLFSISKDGQTITVTDEYISSNIDVTKSGTYTITCTYEEKIATIDVNYKKIKYNVVTYVEAITINVSLVEKYDFLSLFVATKDGKAITITEDMITNNVIAEAGTYTYVVSNHGVSATLTVNVTNDHEIEVVETYNNVEIYYDELLEYDYTELFSLYVNRVAVQVKKEMIDLSNLENAEVGNSYIITLNYEKGISKISYDIDVKVIAPKEVNITSKNLVIYPNSEYIELSTLFDIEIENQVIPVTNDMITGSIDYTKVGVYEIKLNYLDYEAISTVKVEKGVVIDYRYSDVISIRKGQNQETYDFANDFKVVVNGIEMSVIPDKYLDYSNVDFSTPGTYEAKITIPYNDKSFGLSGPKFTYFEKVITYAVVNNNYQITILDDLVEFDKNTTEYDVYKNLKVTINGKNQTLTEVPEYASVIACYVQTLSDQIDFSKPGIQEVKIAVYVNGPNEEPIIISYEVIMDTDLVVEAFDKVIYTGDTLYTKDLFSVLEDGVEVNYPLSSISGKVDSFNPGVYNIKISYMGIEAVSRVVVLDRMIIGKYRTLLTTLPTTETNESDEEVVIPGKYLADLVINENGTIEVLGKKAQIINAIDEKTLIVKVGGYEYTLYYDDGIVVLDPDNSIRLPYNDDKRPIIYFKIDMYTVMEKFTVNSSEKHALVATIQCYSIDAFKIQSTSDYSQKWYGLKVDLTSKIGSDTVYSVTWGDITFADDFINDINKESSLDINGNTYKFRVSTKGNAKIIKVDNSKMYAKMTFTGDFNGVNATLFVDQYGGYTFRTNEEVYCTVSSYEVSQMKIGGPDFINHIVVLYGFKEEVFSYKFILNLETKTFQYVEKDTMFGKYQYDNFMIFLDGYGSGILKDDLSSYYEYPFEYTALGKEVTLNYVNTDYTFKYGESAKLFMDDFGNTLTVGSFEGANIIGRKFENQNVIDGAIIRVNTQKIGADSDANAKSELYRNIEIVTKDGIITGDSVKSYVTTSFIRFNTPGFYEFNIKVNVRGVDVIGYYGLQILESIYTDNALIGTYNGLTTDASMIIDKYGYTIVNYAGNKYIGLIEINEDNSFIVNAYDKTHKAITLSGETISDGVVRVRSSGNVSFNDFLTTGSNDIIGTEGIVLRTVLVGTARTYILSSSPTNLGSIVNIEVLSGTSEVANGSILRIYNDTIEEIVKAVSWGDEKSGLVKSDLYRGTYLCEDKDAIVLDGFGKIKIGTSITGTYELYNNVITVVTPNDTFVYRLNNETFSYEKIEMNLDNGLVQGKILNASYIYYCSNYPYNATTSFEFKENGVVIIRSTSASHDSGEDACIDDRYEPLFASSSGVNGRYSVKGNVLTIEVNEFIITFKIRNVLKADELICLTTNIDSQSHGYFKIGTIFK